MASELYHTIEQIGREKGIDPETIILAVDRLTRELKAESSEAEKDARRLKTVARIVPEFDLGQEG